MILHTEQTIERSIRQSRRTTGIQMRRLCLALKGSNISSGEALVRLFIAAGTLGAPCCLASGSWRVFRTHRWMQGAMPTSSGGVRAHRRMKSDWTDTRHTN